MNELLTMLESKYKRLEYIQSTGTQYIDTGVKGVCSFEIVAQGTLENYVSQLILARDIYKGNYFGKFAETYKWSIGGGTSLFFSENYITKQSFLINFKTNGISATCNGIILTNSGTANLTNNIYMFCGNDNGSPNYFANCKIYSAKCTQNNQIVRNFVPVLRKSDNEIGMLDLVEGKFYPNAGTGKFTANLDTMYALIQGTPTVQDGRVSGFSSSNYLKLQQQLYPTKPFELVAKINISSIGSSQTVFGTSTSTYIQLGVRGTGVPMLLLGQGGASFNIGTLYGTTVLSTNTDYWIKGKFTGTKYELYLSTDGINWNLEKSIESSTLISNSPITLQMGNGHIDNWYLRGSIDLNRSYIKIDDTKYKLQAVVGYTKVGSPTITDGVVSGFSDSNYLTLPQLPQDSTEIQIDFTLGSSITTDIQNILNTGLFAIAKTEVKNIGTYDNSSSSWKIIIPQSDVVASSRYIIKVVKNDNNLSFYYSKDGGNFINSLNWTSNNSYGLFIMIGKSSINNRYFKGTLNLNNTFIKVNKLWFNGLPNN